MSDIVTKLQVGYAEVADGSGSSRSWGNINPAATDEDLVNLAKKINSLQDTAVKTMVSVKRVDTKTLNLNTEA